MGATTYTEIKQHAKNLLVEKIKQEQKLEKIKTELSWTKVFDSDNKQKIAELEEQLKMEKIHIQRLVVNYYKQLITLGQITTKEELEKSFERFQPAKYITSSLFKEQLFEKIKQ